MSASSKKKLRNEQEAVQMTERQLAEQKEARKVKMYTIGFVTVIALFLVIAIVIGVSQGIANSGTRERGTVALTVGDREVSSAELNYFFIDTVNNFNNQYGAYAAMFGLDPSKPLNEQVVDPETGKTWADDFLDSAKNNAKSVYTLVAAANEAGHTLNEDEKAQVDMMMSNLDLYGQMSGQGSAKNYLKALYGAGSNLETYRTYVEDSILAESYQRAYAESLVYEDADLREAEKDNFHQYSAFTYNQYYVSASEFLTGGTTAEDGTVTYSDEEKAASVEAAKEAADSLTSATSVEDLDAAIAALPINADNAGAASTAMTDNPYTSITADVAAWLSEDGRKTGDVTVIPNVSADPEGTETVNGYYVVCFGSVNDNAFPLVNVRHILVNFEGGTPDENGQVVYSDEEKAAAREKAEDLLAQWESGDKTEDSFAALATENTQDPGSKDNGGLYENVYPGQMVPSFNDWCFDEARKPGDTGIVESTYGYHVMFYCADSDVTFRDFQIENELKNQDMDAWYTGLMDAATVTDGDFSLLRTDLVLGAR